MQTKSSIWNIPNILSMLRMALVPAFVACLLYLPADGKAICLVSAAVFAVTALTDMLDGKIARKYNLVTDFGKFLDPLADKFMVFGALVGILVCPRFADLVPVFVWVTVVVMLRELAVTSLRLVVASKSVVVAASFFGKAKTCVQIAGILLILLEPLFGSFGESHIIAYVMMAAMVFFTLGSGFDYLRTLWPYINGKGKAE